MRRFVVVLFVASCQPSPQPTPPENASNVVSQQEADERFAAIVTQRAMLLAELESGARPHGEVVAALARLDALADYYRPRVCAP